MSLQGKCFICDKPGRRAAIATRTQRTKVATRAARIIEILTHEAEAKHADKAVAEAAAEIIEVKHASRTKNSTRIRRARILRL